jgi:orotate phosphoribosyltransferase
MDERAMREGERQQDMISLLRAQRGHFYLESGHHGNLWLDLELLCLNPEPIRRLADQLAAALSKYEIEMVCGPLVEGAFIALMVAETLKVPFTYSERQVGERTDALFPVRYRVPRGLRPELMGRRVAVVNDVINAGSAVRGTLIDLKECGAETMAIGALAVLGDGAYQLAAAARIALETLAAVPNEIWTPETCPMCANHIPLLDLLGRP